MTEVVQRDWEMEKNNIWYKGPFKGQSRLVVYQFKIINCKFVTN
jgi:hypothetical protein